MGKPNIDTAFWVSDCGQYVARELGGCEYDVMTVDGRKCWLGKRYQPNDFKDQDPRYTHPEFAQAVISFSQESTGKRETFKLGFADLDTAKRIIPLTGNCIIKSYEARFSRRMKLRAQPLKPS